MGRDDRPSLPRNNQCRARLSSLMVTSFFLMFPRAENITEPLPKLLIVSETIHFQPRTWLEFKPTFLGCGNAAACTESSEPRTPIRA